MNETQAKAVKSLRRMMTRHSRDWSLDHRDAWLYGVVVGWGEALPDVAKRHGWDELDVEQLNIYHHALSEGE